jgi:hypothetical protein
MMTRVTASVVSDSERKEATKGAQNALLLEEEVVRRMSVADETKQLAWVVLETVNRGPRPGAARSGSSFRTTRRWPPTSWAWTPRGTRY